MIVSDKAIKKFEELLFFKKISKNISQNKKLFGKPILKMKTPTSE
jgi:hypothetical protein